MPTLLITTINRTCPATECSGCVYSVDTDAGRPVSRHPIPESPMRAHDPNPRGGLRGGRGIARRGSEMLVANYDTVFRFDQDGRFEPFVSHPSCADIHEIAFIGGRLWVTSTRNDLLLGFDYHSRLVEYHNVRTWRRVRECLGWSAVTRFSDEDIHKGRIDFRDPTTHEKDAYDEAHVNSMCASPDGGMHVALGFVRVFSSGETGKACIARVREGSEAEIVYFCEEVRVPIHNVVMQPDGSLLFLDTGNGALVRIHPQSSEVLSTWNFPSRYLRGLCRFADGRLAIGDQNSVVIFDPGAPSVCQRILLSENVRESVHSIACIG